MPDNHCKYCGSYKPPNVEICFKCNNDTKLAKKIKEADSEIKSSLVVDKDGKIVSKKIGRR